MAARDSAMPNAGHSQTNSSGPVGGSGHAHHRETKECGPPPPAGPLEFVCEWPAFGIAESRANIDAQLILDAAQRSIRLWPESEG